MATLFTTLTEKIVNNSQTHFFKLNDVHMEQKKYVTTLNFENETSNRLILQLPLCHTKSGIIEQSTKTYTDLLFDISTEGVKEFVDLLMAIEEESAKQLHSRSGEWFEGDTDQMTVQTFEDMFTPVVRYVNRQQQVCVRVHIPTINRGIKTIQKDSQGKETNGSIYECDIYDKQYKGRILSDIRTDTQILPLVDVKEIRITATSITLHLNLVECMIVKDSASLMETKTQPIRRIHLDDEPNHKNTIKQDDDTKQELETYVSTMDDDKTKVDNEVLIEEKLENTNSYETQEENSIRTDVEKAEQEPEQEPASKIETEKETNANTQLVLEDIIEVKDDDGMEEISSLAIDDTESIKLKKPDEVYKEIYKAAISKAKRLRQVALEAYLDAKKIKAKFMLEDIYDSDDDGDEREDEAEMEEISNI